MDNNTKLENIFNKALEAAEKIVNGEAWGCMDDELSALERLMNVAMIANDLKSSNGSDVNIAFEVGRSTPDFNAHVMPL